MEVKLNFTIWQEIEIIFRGYGLDITARRAANYGCPPLKKGAATVLSNNNIRLNYSLLILPLDNFRMNNFLFNHGQIDLG